MCKNKVYYLGEDKNGKEITSNSLIKLIKWEDGLARGLNKSFAKQVEII